MLEPPVSIIIIIIAYDRVLLQAFPSAQVTDIFLQDLQHRLSIHHVLGNSGQSHSLRSVNLLQFNVSRLGMIQGPKEDQIQNCFDLLLIFPILDLMLMFQVIISLFLIFFVVRVIVINYNLVIIQREKAAVNLLRITYICKNSFLMRLT